VDGLLGRGAERDRLDRILADARAGLSGTLVLRGEPGVGKTSLLDYAQAAAADLAVIRVDGIETEIGFSFGALHQLLRPYLGRADVLAPPQRTALGLAFGLQEGPAPDRFLVGLAALGLLADQATRQPLLCLVDDAQWLDRESADALAFMARRLYADSIAMVFAVREPAASPGLLGGLPELTVSGLAARDAAELLAATTGPRLRPAVAERIVTETGGNPLALIEIGQQLGPGQLSGDAPLPDPVPIGRQLELRYLQEARDLPADTRTLLLTAAADPTGDPQLLWQAGKALGFTAQAAAAAEARHLLTIRDTVRFRHPLIRSAVYYGASFAERQRVHASLGAATDSVAHPDQRAWHLAMAATGPDEAVAAELEQAGERARQRGGWTAAAASFQRAATLTPDPADRGRRLLRAAEASSGAGALGQAQAQLDQAAGDLADQRDLGRAQRVRSRIYHAQHDSAKATLALLAAATELRLYDVRLARDILVEAVVEAQINGQLAPDGTTRGDVARAARALPRPAGTPPTPGDLLLDADTTLQLQGLPAAAPLLRTAIDAVRAAPPDAPETFQWLAAACADATILVDETRLDELARRMETEARRHGAVLPLTLALSHAGVSNLLAGYLSEAQRCFLEHAAIAEARGQHWRIGALLIAAWRGQVQQVQQLLAAVADDAGREGQGYQLVFADYARCVIELGQGRYGAAFASFTADIEDTSQIKFVLPDLAEAAQRAGHHDAAQNLLAQLERLAAASPSPLTLGYLARARALTGEDPGEQAEEHYREAIAQHGAARGPVHLARSQLVYGEWLRRIKRPRDAREPLRAAYRGFDEMGARAFAARARRELSAAGESVPVRASTQDREALTAQESQVAELAAGGATNAEIAAQLYLSPNTIDYHLRKVFRKLGVTSRRQLAGTQLNPSPLGAPDDRTPSERGRRLRPPTRRD
jgi:DNA-binding CsgD family transcriptional regulator